VNASRSAAHPGVRRNRAQELVGGLAALAIPQSKTGSET
jgi:hypothetical protein